MDFSLADIWPYLPYVVAALGVVAAIATTIHIVLNKRDPRAAIAWAGLVWLSPIVGCVVYVCLGINRISRKAVSLGFQKKWKSKHYVPLTEEDLAKRHEFAEKYPNHASLAYLIRQLTGRTALPGNVVKTLIDGDQAYPEMLDAIDGAKRSVTLLSYIFDHDRAGKEIQQRLVAAHKRGVEIRILIDDVGSRYSKPNMVRELKNAGLQTSAFLPTRVPRMFKYANMRNHRKLLVVDGQIGFTGGTNIREGHWLGLEPKFPVQCMHFRFEGPVVAHLQEMFAFDWAFVTGESLDGEIWFPRLSRVGPVWARGIASGPDEDFDKLTLAILGALAAASDRIYIVTPYFLPDHTILQALITAALRGVDVHILLPSKNNVFLVQWATYPSLPYLLERGCRIYWSPEPFDHTKLMVIDGIWSLVGSTNWDPRSLRLNFEFNVECYSNELALALEVHVLERLKQAQSLSLDELRRRPLPARLRDGVARLFSPYL